MGPEFQYEGGQDVCSAAHPYVVQGHGCPTPAGMAQLHVTMPGGSNWESTQHILPDELSEAGGDIYGPDVGGMQPSM